MILYTYVELVDGAINKPTIIYYYRLYMFGTHTRRWQQLVVCSAFGDSLLDACHRNIPATLVGNATDTGVRQDQA